MLRARLISAVPSEFWGFSGDRAFTTNPLVTRDTRGALSPPLAQHAPQLHFSKEAFSDTVGFKPPFQLWSKTQPYNIRSPRPQYVPQSRTQ
jgi:hypothetical protein